MQIGHKVKKVRELRNFTQEFMADKLGIAPASYSRIENGQTKMDFSRLQEIALILDVDPFTLMSFDESFVFNSCQQSGKIINQYIGLAETERNTLIKRIQELEKENQELKRNRE